MKSGEPSTEINNRRRLSRRELAIALVAISLEGYNPSEDFPIFHGCSGAADDSFPDNPLNLSTDKASPIIISEKRCISRPVWSRLSSRDQPRLAKQLKHGYAEMVRRSAKDCGDPTGLLAQAWVHWYYCVGNGQSFDKPLHDIHDTLLFLPFHRAFLYFHERILRDILGSDDFRIPAWDWENDPCVPSAYGDWSAGSIFGGPKCKRLTKLPFNVQSCELTSWLSSLTFSDFMGSEYKEGSISTPHAYQCMHANVHTFLGGYMSYPPHAAADPLFYSHHVNMDRFWCTWSRRYDALHGYWPNDWICMFDEKRNPRRIQITDVLETEPLGYRYDGLPNVDLPDFNLLSVAYARDLQPLLSYFSTANLRGRTGNSPPSCLPARLAIDVGGLQAKPGSAYVVRVGVDRNLQILGHVGVFSHDVPRELTAHFSVPLLFLESLKHHDGSEPFVYEIYGVDPCHPDKAPFLVACRNATLNFLVPTSIPLLQP